MIFPPVISTVAAYRLTRPPSLVVCRLKAARRACIKIGTHTQSATIIPVIVALNSYRFFPSDGSSLRFHTDLRTAIEQWDCWRTRNDGANRAENIRNGKEGCRQGITLTKAYLSER